MVRITKVKFDGSKVRIEYENKREDQKQWDEFTLQSADLPTLELTDALADLRQDVLAICELPADDLLKLTVRGVTLTHTNDVLGACITALKSLKTANAPLVINTPHLPETPYGDGDSPVLATSTVDRLHTLMLAAERYIDGERAQADLFEKVELQDAAAAQTH
jgi:hypothetical protein